jgi:hypothetical protein
VARSSLRRALGAFATVAVLFLPGAGSYDRGAIRSASRPRIASLRWPYPARPTRALALGMAVGSP